jgi:hypothetical protein
MARTKGDGARKACVRHRAGGADAVGRAAGAGWSVPGEATAAPVGPLVAGGDVPPASGGLGWGVPGCRLSANGEYEAERVAPGGVSTDVVDVASREHHLALEPYVRLQEAGDRAAGGRRVEGAASPRPRRCSSPSQRDFGPILNPRTASSPSRSSSLL